MIAGSWEQVKRILCIRLDYMGDVLMTTPAIRALRQSLPGCEITLLTSGSGAAVARYIPEIDDTIVYAAPWMKDSGQPDPAADAVMIATLARRGFDAAVIFTVYSQNPLPAALLCHLAGIPRRLAHCRENPYHLLSDWVRESEPHEQVRHEVRRQLDLVAAIGARADDEHLSIQVPSAATAHVIGRLQALDIDPDGTWIVLHPGATATSRRYPPEHWRTVARGLLESLDCPLVFSGSADEAALVEEIRSGLPRTHSLAGQLDLGQLAALIALAPVLVTNNTGPAHIAAAVGTPVVDLYALTNPQHTPWQVPARVLFRDVPCRYCYKSVCPQGHKLCLTGVAPADVIRATTELLDGDAPFATQPLPPLKS
ncbi:lipopolysaccharide heptosyltransferase II [Noviherbaspirillum denitrificans]|uniref:lipopolysaccharide heptosyltransferase II n=1 Tax=Noviherbaspirillum denitrificans TaxID=1968433 RepID=A0A254TGW2_9BURK|nr:lipopolysaccharide heptosyltransferase II [Noviherbaspirillum denitrificans]OWW19783.1 glycosyl transferase [Noviherbaspirillum denitrificans]